MKSAHPTKSAKTAKRQPLEFREAVEMARWYLLHERYDENLRDLYDRQVAEAASIAQIAPMFSKQLAIGGLSGGNVQTLNFPNDLDISNPLHFDVMREVIAKKIETCASLEQIERSLAMELIKGRIERPSKKAGNKEATFLHSRIVWAVAWLQAEGLTAMRSDETRSDETKGASACDAVATALGELGLAPLTFSGVKRIWVERHSLLIHA